MHFAVTDESFTLIWSHGLTSSIIFLNKSDFWSNSLHSHFFRLRFSSYYRVKCTPIEEMGVLVAQTRPIFPYMVIERPVDWQRAAAAELHRHGGGYSVTGDQQRSYVSFPSSWVAKGRIKWYRRRGKCAWPQRAPRESKERPELPQPSKMEKCIAV